MEQWSNEIFVLRKKKRGRGGCMNWDQSADYVECWGSPCSFRGCKKSLPLYNCAYILASLRGNREVTLWAIACNDYYLQVIHFQQVDWMGWLPMTTKTTYMTDGEHQRQAYRTFVISWLTLWSHSLVRHQNHLVIGLGIDHGLGSNKCVLHMVMYFTEVDSSLTFGFTWNTNKRAPAWKFCVCLLCLLLWPLEVIAQETNTGRTKLLTQTISVYGHFSEEDGQKKKWTVRGRTAGSLGVRAGLAHQTGTATLWSYFKGLCLTAVNDTSHFVVVVEK